MACSRCPAPSLLLVLALITYLSLASAASSFQPQPRLDNSHLAQTTSAAGGVSARTCWYTVQIKTSCASPAHTSDTISLAFGDVYKDEVYAAQLGGFAGAFDRCATDTFKIGGPCGYGVCYLYVRRAGRSGWTPEWIRVYEPASPGTPSTFRYGDPLPNNVWYGLDRCTRLVSPSSSSSASAAVQAM
ncbi:embryo-specific protein ATS3A-like [Lolium rigidum]|uniref:embryo-specific protein ATS3A-like n=1 Tax=Lolium rigidum TaxID=89674 RepID=UPI001F5D5B95|nr:embryo-specific protein ATS3A-like [Lolium rigidum]